MNFILACKGKIVNIWYTMKMMVKNCRSHYLDASTEFTDKINVKILRTLCVTYKFESCLKLVHRNL